jgi:hypothetical protein
VDGATVLLQGDRPYLREPELERVLDFAPDVLVVQLGSNDTKPHNWSSAERFAADLESLLDRFAALPSPPRVVLCRPVPAWSNAEGIRGELVRTDVSEVVERIARERDLVVVDVNGELSPHSERFPDGVHPDAAGAERIAAIVAPAVRAATAPGEIAIPTAEQWTDCGPVLRAGGPGSWDHLLYGGFAGSALRKDGRILLYYQGAYGHRQGGDETPLRRSIGLAVSDDGFHFEKHPDNPVLTWLPNDGPEEGAAAGTATLDEQGRVVLFYGANTDSGPMTVNADVRVARSADGVRFEELGIVLDHGSPDVWASGDELYPLAVLRDGARWVVYYVPSGPHRGVLGVAWGEGPETLAETARVRGSFGRRVGAWGMGSVARVGPRSWALFTNRVHEGIFEVHFVDAADPARLAAPSRRFAFDPPLHATVLLDDDRGRWLLYDRRGDHYGVRVAATNATATGRASAPGACPTDRSGASATRADPPGR